MTTYEFHNVYIPLRYLSVVDEMLCTQLFRYLELVI